MEERASNERTPEAVEDLAAVLEMGNGTPGVRVLFHLAEVTSDEDAQQGVEVMGYLRLAYGQGNFANRLLGNVGKSGRLVLDSGQFYPIVLASFEPSEAPGYLCAFRLETMPAARAA